MKIEPKARGVDRGAGTTTSRDFRDLPTETLAQTNFTGAVLGARPDLERLQSTANFAGEVLNDVEELRAENRVEDVLQDFDRDYATLKENFLKVSNKVDEASLTKMRNQIGKGLEETYTKKFGTDTRALRIFKQKVGNKIRFNDNDIVSAWLTRNTLEGIEKTQNGLTNNYDVLKNHNYKLDSVGQEGLQEILNDIEGSKSVLFNLSGQTSALEKTQEDVNAKADFYFRAAQNSVASKNGAADPDLLKDFIANNKYGAGDGFNFRADEKKYIDELATNYVDKQKARNIQFEQGKINKVYDNTINEIIKLDRSDPDFIDKLAAIKENVILDPENFNGPNGQEAKETLLTAIDNFENGIDPSENDANIDLFSFLKGEIFAGRLNTANDRITYKGLDNREFRSLVGTAISEKQFSELSKLINDPTLRAAAAAESKLYEQYAKAMTLRILSSSDPNYATALLRTQEIMKRKFAEAKKQYPDLTVEEYFKVSGEMQPGRNANYENGFIIENFENINPSGETTKTQYDIATATFTTVPITINEKEKAIIKQRKKVVQVGFNKPIISYITQEDFLRKSQGQDVEDNYLLLEDILDEIIKQNSTVADIEEEYGKEVAKEILVENKSRLKDLKQFKKFYTGRTED